MASARARRTWHGRIGWRCFRCLHVWHRRSKARHREWPRPPARVQPNPLSRIARKMRGLVCRQRRRLKWTPRWPNKTAPSRPHPLRKRLEFARDRDPNQRIERTFCGEWPRTTFLWCPKLTSVTVKRPWLLTCCKGPQSRPSSGRQRSTYPGCLSKIFQPLRPVGHMERLDDGSQLSGQH